MKSHVFIESLIVSLIMMAMYVIVKYMNTTEIEKRPVSIGILGFLSHFLIEAYKGWYN